MLKEELLNLYKLQELQDKCEKMEAILKSNPAMKQLQKLKKDREEIQARLQEKNKRIHNLEEELLHLEQTLHNSYDTVKHLEDRIYGGEVTSIKELGFLEEKRNSTLIKVKEFEEKVLSAMEELDDLKSGLAEIIDLTNLKKQQFKEKQLKINEEIGKIKTELASIKKQIQQLEASISPSLLEKFYKIKKLKHHPVAFIVDGKCNGCMMDVSVMVAAEVQQHKKLIYCENCGRILV